MLRKLCLGSRKDTMKLKVSPLQEHCRIDQTSVAKEAVLFFFVVTVNKKENANLHNL